MMAMGVEVIRHFQYHSLKKWDGVFTRKIKKHETEKKLLFRVFRDYSLKSRPVILEATDNIDSLSCELLGGNYPIVKRYVTPKERNKIANELAFLHHASYIEIGDGARRKVHVNKHSELLNGAPDTKTKPKGIG